MSYVKHLTRTMTTPAGETQLDLNATDLRISRGSVPASAQLAERLKAQILEQQLKELQAR